MSLEHVHADDFDPGTHVDDEGPTLLLFWAQWCGYCARFKPHFDEAGESRDERFVTVDISSESSPLWDEWGVAKVPTVVLLEDGGEVDRVSGVLGEKHLDRILAAID